jgi:SAM-dependent methyltransferase
VAHVDLTAVATEDNFDERAYLASNPDVASAVSSGVFPSGREHFRCFGRNESRRLRFDAPIEPLRERKMARLAPFLREDLPRRWRGSKVDYLTDDLRQQSGIVDTSNVSSNAYDAHVLQVIESNPTGLLLDCGAGRRDRYYDNVVNFEIVDYDTTDVLGVGEVLPFRGGTFDGVFSIAVLEHVRDPFRCADELVRVMNPGGKLICAVPFLQPLHGYPHHYYNMTHQGLRALFDRKLRIDQHLVIDSTLPIWALTWIVQSWAGALPSEVRAQFLAMPVGELMKNGWELLKEPFVRLLPAEKNFELACGTVLFATKE